MKLRFTLALLAAFPFAAAAQVANGSFENGPAFWTWKQARFQASQWTNCSSAAYSTLNADSKQTPLTKVGQVSSRVAWVTAPMTGGLGNWTLCRQIEQTVFVPAGKHLKLQARIGDQLAVVYTPRFVRKGTLQVIVVDAGESTPVLTATGTSRTCDGDPAWCPKFTSHTVDMSPYWGKTVKLVVRGVTSAETTATESAFGYPTNIYVDNIGLE